MRKVIILFCLIFLTACSSKTNELDEFKKQIEKYESYNATYLNEYFKVFQETNSYIKSLNYINHPTFLTKTSKQYIYDNIVLVNKKHGLDQFYVPNNLIEVTDINYVKRSNEKMLINSVVYDNLVNLFLDAKINNINLLLYSAYRSFDKQLSLWDTTPTFDNLYKAVPGYSEHQTGLAVDISTTSDGLTSNKTIAFDFLAKNAHKYGFILRYPKNKESITGYAYEPWHFRYVGSISTFIYENNLTLEEYIYNYIEIKEGNL